MSENPFRAERLPYVQAADTGSATVAAPVPPRPSSLFAFPGEETPSRPTGATVDDALERPFVTPPIVPLPDINLELVPATVPDSTTLPDENVGVTTDPFHASKLGGAEQTYNPFPVLVPPAIADLVDKPPDGKNPFISGRENVTVSTQTVTFSDREGQWDRGAVPQAPNQPAPYQEPGWNVKPLLPEPSIAAEIPVPQAYEPKTMPDETVGTDQSPYFFAASPFPESIYNAYPVEKPPSIADIAAKTV